MIKKSFNKIWEKNKYSKVKHSDKFPYEKVNRYPYDLVVSIVARKFFNIPKEKRKKIKVLDLGCGAGNNAKFLSENGFNVYGIDWSKSAIEICKERFQKWNLKGSFIQGDFNKLPYQNNFFDLVIDRESLYANYFSEIKKTIKEIYKKLKKDGYFISFIYNTYHLDIKFGKKVEPNTYKNFSEESSFYQRGLAHFVDINEILELYSKFKIENIIRYSLSEVYDKTNRFMEFDEYIIILKK